MDNNLFSHLLFDNCSKAFYQHAPSSQREPGTEQCKQAFDNPQMNYMDSASTVAMLPRQQHPPVVY
jgi:hypothetical protein|eukprot:COSAG06_NODE_2855_length_6169_cov_7.820264_9_plen_66_part_00